MGKFHEGKLTDEIRALVVTELALFSSPTEIAAMVKERFNVVITRQGVHGYDPASHRGYRLASRWKLLHKETRRRFLKDITSIPIANRAYRLRMLDKMMRAAEARGNLALAASLIEQAAKEVGDVFTNTQKHKHSGGIDSNVKLSPEQLRDGIMALVQKARRRALAGPEQG